MKRYFLTLAVALLALAAGADTFEVGSLAYSTNTDGTVTCTGIGSSGSVPRTVTVPGFVTNPNDSKRYQVKTIGVSAFENQTRLTSVTIQYGVEELSGLAFKGCTGLKTVYLPSSLRNVYSNVFYNAPIQTVYCAAETMPNIGTYAFEGMAASATGSRTWYVPTEDAVSSANGQSVITSSFTTARNPAACDFTATMASVDYHCNITALPLNLQSNRFRGQCKVVGIALQSGNTTGAVAPTQLSVTHSPFTYNISEIGKKACFNNSSVTSLDLSALSFLTTIGESAFASCENIDTIALPANLTTLKSACFANCSSIRYFHIPASLTTISNTATFLSRCTNLQKITVAEDNPNFASPDGLLYNKAVTTLYFCPPAYAGISDDFGDANCYYAPHTLKHISTYAFLANTKIKRFYATSLETIGSNAFEDCTQLQDVQLPSSLKSMGNYLFKDCTSLFIVIINRTIPPAISRSLMFSGCTQPFIYLVVPYGSEDAYEQAGWSWFTINTIAERAYDRKVAYKVNNTVAGSYSLTFTSRSARTINNGNYDGSMRVDGLRVESNANTTLSIPGSVEIGTKRYAITSIGQDVLNCNADYCTIRGCELIDSVGDRAFRRNNQIRSIHLPYASYIGKQAFEDSYLTGFMPGNRLRVIDKRAFNWTAATIILPYGVHTIADSAFAHGSRQALLIPSSVQSLSPSFAHQSKINNLTINNAKWAQSGYSFDFTGVPDTCKVFVPVNSNAAFEAHADWSKFQGNIIAGSYDIYDGTTKAVYTVVDPAKNAVQLVYRYGNQANLTELDYVANPVITDGNYGGEYTLTELGDACLLLATNLERLVLPDSITSIPRRAFEGCSSLTELTIPFKVSHIGSTAMAGMTSLRSLQCLAVTPPALGENVWKDTDQSSVTFTVPQASVGLYRAAAQWKEFFGGIPGDVNGDGSVDVGDLNIITNVLLGANSLSEYPAADLNGDNKVDVSDLNTEIGYLLSK